MLPPTSVDGAALTLGHGQCPHGPLVTCCATRWPRECKIANPFEGDRGFGPSSGMRVTHRLILLMLLSIGALGGLHAAQAEVQSRSAGPEQGKLPLSEVVARAT